MSQRPIIDAGPSLNFLSINRERLLIATIGKLSAPESVQAEVFRKAGQDDRFRPAAVSWKKLTPTYIEVLADDPTIELAQAVNRITSQRMDVRLKQSKDLGETMVIAHAVVAAEAGADVVVLIDDGRGAQDATREIQRLRRLRDGGAAVGSITLASTLTVLTKAVGMRHIRDRGEMREIYGRLRGLDDGLPPIEKTDLLTTPLWKQGR
ncbi:hypothetical protein [Asanoa siamensis]|uniref:Uncharacterized protein n=1 Tax=Asanoa siamensis TaxID=926357 RepID=A0ABQ4CPV2_9ACTN|nr:hypothetical protein [Asanoa siamensis]GIF73309.1 hypothetical protein Asi02nite_28270 [Asanoa siamensis]